MNKKFISVLLFGAMLFASTSMFVSCSYEEDIATLRTDVTDLTSLVNSKMQAVEAEIDALGSQTETLEAAYEAAMEAIANAEAEAKEAAQANAAQIAAAMELINSAVADLQAAFDADVADLVAKDAELTSAITAAQAKAEQASALVAELKTVVEALQKTVENLDKQMTILGGKVSALEEAAQKNAAAIEAQAKIVAELQKSTGEDLAELVAAVEAAKAEAAAAAAEAKAVVAKATEAAKEAMTADLDALKTAYAAADAKLANDIKEVKDSVDALAVKVDAIQKSLLEVNANLVYESKRLKSLVFVPETYVDGVECIDLVSLKYKNWVSPYYVDAPNGTETIHLDDSTTTIEYLVNPENVLKNDIVGLSFISNDATNLNGPTRAVSQNAPISVKSFEINNGVMGVTIYKNNPASLGTDRESFKIVSLKATLSDKFLTEEEIANGEKAEVYSDWARLRETSVTPYIHNRLTNIGNKHVETKDNAHFWTFHQVYGSNASTPANTQLPTEYNDKHVAKEVVYTDSIDLLTLVEVCDKDGRHFDLDDYGFEFQFNLMNYKLQNKAETQDYTDQIHFAKLKGTILSSTARDNTTEMNRDAIGRQPMIQVVLWDKNHKKAVDVKYFKIKWVANVVTPEQQTVNVKEFGQFGAFTAPYACATEFSKWILEEKVNAMYTFAGENGMSRDEFHATYELVPGLFSSLNEIKKETPAKSSNYGTFDERNDADGAGQTWNYLWTISTAKQKMTMTEYLAGKKEVTVWGYFVNKKNSYDRIAFQLQFTWTISRFGLADGYNRDEVMWTKNNTLRNINPALDSDTEYGQNSYHGVTNLFETTQIVGSLLEGYIKNGQTPYDVTEMVNKNGAEAKWVFDEDKLTGHLAGYSVSADGTKLMKGLTTAATVDPIYGTIQLWESNNGAIDSKPSEPSKHLVGNTVPVKIVASWCGLTEEFEHHDVNFLTPLEFKSDEAICELYDITSGGYSAVTFADKFEIREKYTTNKRVVWDNKKVDSKTNEALVEWYQVSKVMYDVKNAKTNITKNGQIGANCTTLLTDLKDAKGAQKYIVEMGYDANGNDLYEVWFYNKSGDAIGKEFKIEIPVKVTTKWQDELTATIKVTVKPSI